MRQVRAMHLVGVSAVAILATFGCRAERGVQPGLSPFAYSPTEAPAEQDVEILLSVRAEDLGTNDRHLQVRWTERLERSSAGEIERLVLVPSSAARREATPDAMAPLAYPQRVVCSRDSSKPSEHGLIVSMESTDRPVADAQRAEWEAILQSLLFFEELAYVVLPRTAGDMSEWEIDLDAAKFAKQTRLGVWAEEGLAVRGVAGLLADARVDNAAWAPVRAVLHVERKNGQRLELVADVVYDRTARSLVRATIVGMSKLGGASQTEGPDGMIHFEIKAVNRQ